LNLPCLTLILGGARSGKSHHAETLVERSPPPWVYVATAQPFDDEMRARITAHRERRPKGWTTVEAPLEVAEALRSAPRGAPVLVDCLTLWLTNLMLANSGVEAATDGLLAACADVHGPVVLVSNEVGEGIVPENELARRFRDHAGVLHQRVAARADRVVLMVAGLPLVVK
jgi:adenosylcobinamide kinase/adenosylcobinamide-phosphate guanylyltransferase